MPEPFLWLLVAGLGALATGGKGTAAGWLGVAGVPCSWASCNRVGAGELLQQSRVREESNVIYIHCKCATEAVRHLAWAFSL